MQHQNTMLATKISNQDEDIHAQIEQWIENQLVMYVCNNFIPPFAEEYTQYIL